MGNSFSLSALKMGYQSDGNTTENHVKSEKESASARLEKILGYGRFQKQQESVATKFYSILGVFPSLVSSRLMGLVCV